VAFGGPVVYEFPIIMVYLFIPLTTIFDVVPSPEVFNRAAPNVRG